MRTTQLVGVSVTLALIAILVASFGATRHAIAQDSTSSIAATGTTSSIVSHATDAIRNGRHTFRFDTFGDESFWGATVRLHEAIEGSRFGGVGGGFSPRAARALGCKVDSNALTPEVRSAITHGNLDLDDPANTLALLK